MSASPTTFVDFLFLHARLSPQKPAIVLADRVATYDMLAQGVLRIENRLRGLALAPGEIVCVTIDNAIRHMIVAAALFRLGHPVMSASQLADVATLRLPVRTYLQDAHESLVPGLRQVVVGDDWFEGERLPIPQTSPAGFANEDAICRIDVSSGATGRPKAISYSVKAFNGCIANIYFLMALGASERSLFLVGLNGLWGFCSAAQTLASGKTAFMTRNVRDTLRMIDLYEIDALRASAQQLRDIVRAQRVERFSRRSLRVVFTAGSLLTRELLLELRARLCSHIVNAYGSTETHLATVATADQIMEIEGATGYVAPGAELEIVGPDDSPLPAGADGIVRIRTPWQGAPFPPGAPDARRELRNGWFYPGDRGRFEADGLLILAGRVSEVINSGGFKIAPELAEEVLLKHPNVAEAAAFGAPGEDGVEEIHVAIVARAPLDANQLIAWSRERNLPIARVFQVDALPKTALGKIRREAVKQQLQR